MKCYELSGGRLREGIGLERGNIVLGEEGRGRRRVEFPLPNCSVTSQGRVLEVPANKAGYLLCIRDHSGFRGTWRLTAARSDREWRAIVARNVAHRPPLGEGPVAPGHSGLGPCRACDEIAIIPERKPGRLDRVIAEGRKAQGIGGYMGGGPELLLVLRPGDQFEIVRTGRLYGEPEVVAVVADEQGVRVYDPYKRALEAYMQSLFELV